MIVLFFYISVSIIFLISPTVNHKVDDWGRLGSRCLIDGLFAMSKDRNLYL